MFGFQSRGSLRTEDLVNSLQPQKSLAPSVCHIQISLEILSNVILPWVWDKLGKLLVYSERVFFPL